MSKLACSTSYWSSPTDTTGWGVSPRGAGYLFGSDVVAQFNAANDIHMICRAHQLVMEGYKWHFNETVLTVWSAPNYCYRYVNKLQNTFSLLTLFKKPFDFFKLSSLIAKLIANIANQLCVFEHSGAVMWRQSWSWMSIYSESSLYLKQRHRRPEASPPRSQ